jgi:tRNA splicing endonuclease
MKPNEEFKLSVRDIDMIEHALRDRQRRVSTHRLTLIESTIKAKEEIKGVQLADQELLEITDLLARLHNQKNFYRPKNKVYVSG